jgi:hypothetical protein
LGVIAERLTREETDRFVVPILVLEPIPPDQGPYLRLDYYWQIIEALKEIPADNSRVGAAIFILPAITSKTKKNAQPWWPP